MDTKKERLKSMQSKNKFLILVSHYFFKALPNGFVAFRNTKKMTEKIPKFFTIISTNENWALKIVGMATENLMTCNMQVVIMKSKILNLLDLSNFCLVLNPLKRRNNNDMRGSILKIKTIDSEIQVFRDILHW